jgi:hypothetical protein
MARFLCFFFDYGCFLFSNCARSAQSKKLLMMWCENLSRLCNEQDGILLMIVETGGRLTACASYSTFVIGIAIPLFTSVIDCFQVTQNLCVITAQPDGVTLWSAFNISEDALSMFFLHKN